ncbi:MAG: lysoplasmalogenase [Mycobacterium sp.]|nr:lysoplasmalogenase [Mycobacterium sp.]
MGTRYAGAARAVRLWWAAGLAAALGYGVVLAVIAARLPAGAELNGRFWGQPLAKAAMAILLAVAASRHPITRERRWLVPALLLSALGDFLLAIPWWTPAFVCGLGAFLVAHLCYLGALLPLRGNPSRTRMVTVAIVIVACVSMLARFWPKLVADGLTIPVTVYITVLGAMVCSALVARLPTVLTAVGAVLFAVSDGMIGVGQFVLGSPALELPIWWVYAASQVLITAGFFFGRARD